MMDPDSAHQTVGGNRQGTVLDDFLRLASAHPDKVAVVSYLVSRPDPVSLTYGDMAVLVDKLALKLISLGVKPRDFVSYQFPNRWEFVIAHLATIRIGAISNPLMPIFGKRELRFMLERTASKVCIALKRTPRTEPGKVLEEIRDDLPSLEHLILVDDDDPTGSLESQLADISVTDLDRERLDRLAPKPDDVEVILFSSGTTGEPKGVLHSFNSTYRATSNAFAAMEMSERDVVLMPSPLAHATGFDYGVEMPLYCGCKAVYMEAWDPQQMLRLIEKEGITWSKGSAAFVKDVCDAAETTTVDTSTFRCFVSGGAPIPPKLVGRAARLLGAQLIPCWGSTEVGIATIGKFTDSEEKRSSSDGSAVDGVTVRVVDDEGRLVPPNTPGHLQLRASGQHVGYFMNDALYEASFENGWFKTGDLGRLDEDGYVRIVGRSKDIVIRGGENVPIIEIENLLLDIPEVADIVIVGVPDDRLGERCHAVVVPRTPGRQFSLTELTAHLATLDVTKQYWPEFISTWDALPRTASGKIQRFVVRDKIIQEGK
ncbi:AMP-binding protein [Sphingobium subterraneum]|uniref:Cyclohexanecarboxylate-CoA ligase n=1 Tax=Sphingobium subterraneum TaxID=627688 RepID=A0A841J590_9SPHN|nr:AMP-binding protein [Sphingobium subterraneum]MBB6123391.1 cyclohexanecarboxylate-CoA ligase [Sphingobium subterraneum]